MEWESGFQPLGPPRLQTLRHYLTPVDHPEWLWQLHRLETNPYRAEDGMVVESELSRVELCTLIGGIFRFLRTAIWTYIRRATGVRVHIMGE
jgi:hypothetical protein